MLSATYTYVCVSLSPYKYTRTHTYMVIKGKQKRMAGKDRVAINLLKLL